MRRAFFVGAFPCLFLAPCRPFVVAQAPVPVLQELSPPAAEPGKVTRVTLVGKNLEKVTRILLDEGGLRASLCVPPPPEAPAKKEAASDGKSPPEPSTLVWDIGVDEQAPPGLYDLRVVNELGISAPRPIHVSRVPLVVGKDSEKSQPVEISPGCRIFGHVEAGEVERLHWKASQRARVVVECLAERLGSRLDAALQVKEASGKRLAYSHDRVGGDPIVAFDAAAGGDYTVELWDFTYQGKYPYVLSISSSPRLLFAFPPLLPAVGQVEVALYGWNLPGSTEVKGRDEPLEELKVMLNGISFPGAAAEAPFLTCRSTRSLCMDALEVRPPGIECEPLLFRKASSAMTLEREPNDSPREAMAISSPCEVCGRFDRARDLDWYSFRSKKGEHLEIEVFSSRLGAPCDPLLLIAQREVKKTKEAGKENEGEPESIRDLEFAEERRSKFPRNDSIQRKFLAPARDPVISWTAPSDGEYLIQVRNRNQRSGLDALYVLSVREATPDFSLVAIQSENLSGEAATVPQGGAQSYDVLLDRERGFEGSIKVTVESLPAGVTSPPVYLAKDEAFVPLVFLASADAQAWSGNVEVVATGEWEGKTIRRTAASAVTIYGGLETRHPLQYVQSRLTRSLPIAVRGPPAFSVRLELPEKPVPPGGKVSIAVKVSRRDGFQEPVQLSYQGLGEEAFPDDNGQRPAKLTVEKDKTDAAIQISLRNNAPYGPHTFVAYGSAQVEYSEVGADPKGKKERKKKRTTFPSNPVTIQAAPPVTLAASEIKAVIPAGGQLKVPFEVRRLEGVDGEVEAALQIPAGLKGFSAAAVKLKKGENAGEILLQSELDGDEVEACGFQLRTRVDFAGKTFEEKSNLHLAVERRPPLHMAVVGDSPWEICRGGTLLVPVRVDLADGVTGKVSLALTAPKETKGIEGAPVELAEGSRVGQVKVFLREGGPGELQGLELEASIEKDGKKFAVKAPLPRVRVRAALELGEVAQARVGALRFEMRRHPSLQAGSDLRLRLEATAPAGLSTKAEVHFEKGESSKGVLLDTASLLDLQKNAPLFPLKIRAGILSEKGEVVEEHVLEAN